MMQRSERPTLRLGCQALKLGSGSRRALGPPFGDIWTSFSPHYRKWNHADTVWLGGWLTVCSFLGMTNSTRIETNSVLPIQHEYDKQTQI